MVAPLSTAREGKLKNFVVVQFPTFVSEPPDDRSARGNATRSQEHSQ